METLDRAVVIDQQFRHKVRTHDFPQLSTQFSLLEAGLTKSQWLQLFDSQLISRHLDLIARKLKQKGLAYYTIGSSGHEGNAVLGLITQITDMAFLHYRSAAFQIMRSYQAGLKTEKIIENLLLSLVASAQDPMSGGRHKVLGSADLFIPPQTSTIASHLPKALGAAFGITLGRQASWKRTLPDDATVIVSFGDASFNHSTTQGALNSAAWIVRKALPLRLLLVCEDNGFGISVPTPDDWITSRMSTDKFCQYMACDGRSLASVYQAAKTAVQFIQQHQRPVFLHIKTVRLLGHAGSDIESQYRSVCEIERTEADDPLLHSVREGIEAGWLSAEQALSRYEQIESLTSTLASAAVNQPKLQSATEIMSSLLPSRVSLRVPRTSPIGIATQIGKPKTLAQAINTVLQEQMLLHDNMVIFGEDVAKKGGVYRVTANLYQQFGGRRVFDTPLDEQTILGVAIGLAQNGFFPVPEIQFLAYLHNAIDQLRGEAATLSFFSNGQFCNPMIIRLPSFAYQQGFGGHFHNENTFAALRDIPTLVIACPRDAGSAPKLFRECVRLVLEERRLIAWMEPIARYMTKDCLQQGDKGLLMPYPDMEERLSFGYIDEVQAGETIAIITYGNGCYLSQRASFEVEKEQGLRVGIFDCVWLSPLPIDAIVEALQPYEAVLIVDECRQTVSLSEQLLADVFFQQKWLVHRICAKDCFIPLGEAWQQIVPSENEIKTALLRIIGELE